MVVVVVYERIILIVSSSIFLLFCFHEKDIFYALTAKVVSTNLIHKMLKIVTKNYHMCLF